MKRILALLAVLAFFAATADAGIIRHVLKPTAKATAKAAVKATKVGAKVVRAIVY
jgi:hypothetical protein